MKLNTIAPLFWNRKWVISLTIGILLGLSWPPLPFPFLVFPAFILLFRLIDLCATAREAAYWSYPALVIWNIITTYWLVMATVAGGIAAILANAAVMTVPIMLQHRVQKKLDKTWLIVILQAAFWVSYEYLHHQWDLAWPWLALGNAWANVPELVQYISVTGYLGISAWVLLVSALAYQAWHTGRNNMGLAAAAVGALLPILSLVQLQSVQNEGHQKLDAVVVQPNFDSYQNYGGLNSPAAALTLLTDLTDSVRTENTRMVVWPENGLYPYVSSAATGNSFANRLKPRLKQQAQQWNATIISGTTYFEYFRNDSTPRLPNPGGNRPYLAYNSALGFYPDSTMEVYRKFNLVPIVERIPFVHFLDAADLFGLVDWARIQGYGKGYDDDRFRVGTTSTPALVCYDSVFPGWVREFVTDGAGLITIITNDGWWGNTGGHSQHFAYARLRALEFRRWVVRSANNGISGIIAPDGSVKVETDYWTRTAFRYRVPVKTEMTFYARHGDWLPLLMLILSATGIGWLIITSYLRK